MGDTTFELAHIKDLLRKMDDAKTDQQKEDLDRKLDGYKAEILGLQPGSQQLWLVRIPQLTQLCREYFSPQDGITPGHWTEVYSSKIRDYSKTIGTQLAPFAESISMTKDTFNARVLVMLACFRGSRQYCVPRPLLCCRSIELFAEGMVSKYPNALREVCRCNLLSFFGLLSTARLPRGPMLCHRMGTRAVRTTSTTIRPPSSIFLFSTPKLLTRRC